MKTYFNLLIFIFLYQLSWAAEPVALVSKLRGSVRQKIFSTKKYRTKVQVNSPIFHETELKTNSKAFAKIVYLDDGTSISIYPETEIKIIGTVENRIINKQVELKSGIIQVNIIKQALGKFKLTTPHSELNCEKCSFWVISDEENGDKFYKEDGSAVVYNPSLDKSMELAIDSTFVSKKDMLIEKNQSTVTEIKYLELLLLDADEQRPEIDIKIEENISNQDSSVTRNVVVIKLKNAANIERELILTYTQ
jgi:hypothetical protein